jgi:hypothetical protein
MPTQNDRARRFALYLAMICLWPTACWAQSSSFVAITPQSATLLPGESRSFRLVDQNGRLQHNVTWTVSDPEGLEASPGDELTITAKQPGEFRIEARSENGSAEATVKVVEGKLPVGTAIWTTPDPPGCKPKQMVQAVPSNNGPDMYDISHCEDGDYVTALTSDGIVLWRRRIGDRATRGTALPPEVANKAPAARLDAHSSSVCDSLSTGTEQEAIRDLLHQRNLSFSEGSEGERSWIVEESNTECKLWFDEKLILVKKRKVFVSQ